MREIRALALVVVLLAASAASAQDTPTVRLGLQAAGTFSWVVHAIQYYGVDQEMGLTLEPTTFASKQATELALRAGDVDVVVDDFVGAVSMQQRVGPVTRLEIAKEATLQAVELLHPESRVGVVVFDSESRVLAPMGAASDRARLEGALAPLQPNGGTALYPALLQALEQLAPVDAPTKHVVVMTDGLSQPGDFAGALARLREAGITVSTVAIGQGADAVQLQQIARAGGSTAHVTSDFRALPSILAQEALLLSGSPIEEGSVAPRWADRGPVFTRGLPDALPPLTGYVTTTAKPQAAVELVVPVPGREPAPLLASWRYGLGHVVAFTAHGAGPWTRAWLDDPAYPRLWAQALRWLMPRTPGPGVSVDLAPEGDGVRVTAQALAGDGTPLSGLTLAARRVRDGATEGPATPLHEVEPGVYVGRLRATAPGALTVEVATAIKNSD